MEEEKSCCAASAARKIRKVTIDGQEIGIAQLETIFSRVSAMELEGDEETARALMNQVKIFNYVPPSKDAIYQRAILNAYARRNDDGE